MIRYCPQCGFNLAAFEQQRAVPAPSIPAKEPKKPYIAVRSSRCGRNYTKKEIQEFNDRIVIHRSEYPHEPISETAILLEIPYNTTYKLVKQLRTKGLIQ